jgi:hypothetical protein
MRTIVGYAGRLDTIKGHYLARMDAAKRAAKHDPKAERERERAEKELGRFLARWGNGDTQGAA